MNSKIVNALKRRADITQCPVKIWWRDDDACVFNGKIQAFVNFAENRSVPCALAVIIGRCERQLIDFLTEKSQVDILVHGWNHHRINGVGTGEFDITQPELAGFRAKLAIETGNILFKDKLLPVLVPPWNISEEKLFKTFSLCGYIGISKFGGSINNFQFNNDSFIQIDTHVDLLDWSRGGQLHTSTFIENQFLLSLNTNAGPIGILTHHNISPVLTLNFLQSLFDEIQGFSEVEFVSARKLYNLKEINNEV